MVKIKMKRTIVNGWTRTRLDEGREYDIPAEQAEAFVPQYAAYVDGPPAEGEPDTNLNDLTVPQLKELAAKMDVELTGTKKADIIVEIETAMAETENEGE